MGELDDRMWSMFLDSLAQKVGGVSRAEFLPTSGLALANWEAMDVTGLPRTGKEKPGDPLVAGITQWGDAMPEWRPTYVPGESLYRSYVAFLNSIQLKGGDPAQQQIADAYAASVDTARKQLQKHTNAMFKAWAKMSAAQASLEPAQRQTYTQWYNDNWASTIKGDQDNLAAQSKNYSQALQAVGGPDFQTIDAAQSRVKLNAAAGNALTDASGLAIPRYDITPGLNAWYVSALQSVTKGSPPQIDFTVDFGSLDQYSATESSYVTAGAAARYSSFFWGGSAAASYEEAQKRTEFSQLLTNLRLHYTAQAATVFDVKDPPWFDASIVKAFSDQISPNSAYADEPMFGPDGFLNLRTRQIVVVFRPTVALEGSASDISAVTKAFDQKSAATLSVGGFTWGGSASAAQEKTTHSAALHATQDGTKVEIADNTNNPKVVGVVPQRLG